MFEETLRMIRDYIHMSGMNGMIKPYYGLRYDEFYALEKVSKEKSISTTIMLAFEYGMARGYAVAQAEKDEQEAITENENIK